ncbi:MAG: hypothetical protein MHM6MM_001863 [Cercozoa sp. M6MM]
MSGEAATADNIMRVNKRLLRQAVRTDVAALSQDAVRAQSQQVAIRLMRLPEFARARAVAAFDGIEGKELDTAPLLAVALQGEKRVFLPRCLGKRGDNERHFGGMTFLPVADLSTLESWPRNSWGIREPPFGDKDAENFAPVPLHLQQQWQRQCAETQALIDVFLVPGSAFSEQGARLGQGCGFYDRYLTAYQQRRQQLGLEPATLVGVALDQQKHDELPLEPHDVRMDIVVFPSGAFRHGEPLSDDNLNLDAE